MKETIYTIPISEVFEPREGCPVCRLVTALEERWVQYITGAAMMEPDVRVQTNERGFCARHLTAMLGQRNRLSVALMLQTRLDHLMKNPNPKPAASTFGLKRKTPEREETCFVCDRVRGELARLADNLVTVWAREESFRTLYSEQEYLCVPHHGLLSRAGQALRGPRVQEFRTATDALLRQGLEPAKADIDAFCYLFDYRSNGDAPPPAEVASAVERAARLLCGNLFEG